MAPMRCGCRRCRGSARGRSPHRGRFSSPPLDALRWTASGRTGMRLTATSGAAPMKISTFFTRVFTWWNGQTFGTQVWTSLYGEVVGEDEFGNRYYRTKGGKS